MNIHTSIIHNSSKLESTLTSSVGECANKTWSICTMQYYSVTQINELLEDAETQITSNMLYWSREPRQKDYILDGSIYIKGPE